MQEIKTAWKDKAEGKVTDWPPYPRSNPIHAGATGAFREAQWISDTKEDPEQLHILSLSMGTAFGNSWHGMRSHHLHLHRRHSALLSWPPELCRVVQKRMQLKKRKINISFSVLECGFSHSWSIFGHLYKIQFRCSSSSVSTVREFTFISWLTLYFQGGLC